MKINILGESEFCNEAIEIYRSIGVLVQNPDEADIIVSQLTEVKTDRKVVVATNTTGLDHIDAPNAEIVSLRGEDLSDFTAVAELCLAMMIRLFREFKREEIKGKTLGIIGMGRIGSQFARMAEFMGMRVLGYDKNESRSQIDLMALLRHSDAVSLHITSDIANTDFLDVSKMVKMKKGSILLNSSRPWIVYDKALRWGLRERFAGVWFDFNMPFKHERLVTTPHLGGTTKESQKRSQMLIAQRVKKIYG